MREYEKGEASNTRMIVDTLHVAGRTYEQRYNRCGKANCGKCNPPKGAEWSTPGHGPYWYLLITRDRRLMRVYIGKNLNTQLYTTADGRIDFNTIRAEHAERKARAKARKEKKESGA